MLILIGKTLGERQKELNKKVTEAALKNVDFEEVKGETEHSDIDKLFKIDLASKYMNIEYIVEVLKSGDNLHTSRALECAWMYDDEFSKIISVDYLHHNVFPFMSHKMKKKLLTCIANHVRNEERALAFFNYCKEAKLINIALKFVIFTSDDFKLKLIKEDAKELRQLRKLDFKQFIGTSFTLLDSHLSTLSDLYDSRKINVFIDASYLYSVSDIKYLDMLEKYVKLTEMSYNGNFGLRLSKAILTKHKDRVLKSPLLYLNILNKHHIVKFSSVDDAKVYATALLPQTVEQFWAKKNWQCYNHIFSILPADQRFDYMKKIFNEKYPGELLEMNPQFYHLQYFKYMTAEQKEKWALDHIASQKEILGLGKDYIWYKFVKFEIAFDEIKKLIMITHDNNKRADMIHILVDSAKTQRDLEKLFNYYYDRHNNEQRYNRENFIDNVTYHHNVYEFDNDCWTALNKIFQNLDVYSMLDYNSCKSEFKIIALIYQVVNNIDVHDALKLYISTNLYFYTLKLNTDKLTKEQQNKVFQFLFDFYMEKVNEFDSADYNDEIKYKLRKYIHFILDLLHQYDRTKENIPEVVTKLMKLDWDEYKCHKLHYEHKKEITTDDLLRFLKKDAKLAVDNIPEVKKCIERSYRFNMTQLLKKLRVYFSNDISKEYIKFYNKLLTESQLYPKVAQAAVYGIFQLADDSFKIDFMLKNAPLQTKINRSEMNQNLLHIQEAICATACYSRPPVPLKNMLMYVKGDYVKSCLPLFNYYFANLPLPLCMEFVNAILNTPLSVQKHGVRLAFACFNAENLRRLVLQIWRKTKNISLRLIIYRALYDKIVREDRNTLTALFETLTTLTLELHQEDDNELFALLTSGTLPSHLISDYVEVVWKAVNALNNNITNVQRKCTVIKYMCKHIRDIRQDVIRPIVKEFMQDVFETEEILVLGSESDAQLIEQKWNLTSHHIMYLQNEDDLDAKMELTKNILIQCQSKYMAVSNDKYAMRYISYNFVQNLLRLSISQDFNETCVEYNEYLNILFGNVLKVLSDSFSIEDVYMLVWEIRLDIAVRKALVESGVKLAMVNDKSTTFEKLRDIILNYGKDIGNLVKEYIEKEAYFTSFVPLIESKLAEKTWSFDHSIIYDINDDVLVVISLALMEFNVTELHLLALNIVPSFYDGYYKEDYVLVLNKLKELNSVEIKCKLYQKFVNTDFKPRALLQL